MPLSFDIGDKSPTSTAAPNGNQSDLIILSVAQGQTVTLKNVAGDTLNVYLNGLNGSATTVTATNTQSITAPTWIQSTGRTSCQVSGNAVYGN